LNLASSVRKKLMMSFSPDEHMHTQIYLIYLRVD